MILRPADLDDVSALCALAQESFSAAFGHLYSPEDLKTFLEETHSPEVVAAEISSSEFAHHLAADDAGLIGYCKLQRPSGYKGYSDALNPVALSQLYTVPFRTGEGIGAALMDWAIGESRAAGCDAIQLSVFSQNPGAQRFYRRYGFKKLADIKFEVGNQVDHDFLYELRL